MTRRSRPSVSLEIQAHCRHLARFEQNDVAVAKSLIAADWNLAAAARLAGVKPDTYRQRLASYVRRLRLALGGTFHVGGGRRPREVSRDQYSGLGVATGIDS